MKKIANALGLMLILGLSCTSASIAEDLSPPDWQKQSLKGITSLRYAVADGSTYDATEDLAKSLDETKVPATRIIDSKEDANKPLSTSEARVKVVAMDRSDNQCWVGLFVDQLCQLKRKPSITVSGETYKVGKMCPRADVKKTVNDLCAQFVRDFSAQKK